MEGELLQTAVSRPAQGSRWNRWCCGQTGGRSGQPGAGRAEGQDPSGDALASAGTLTLPSPAAANRYFTVVPLLLRDRRSENLSGVTCFAPGSVTVVQEGFLGAGGSSESELWGFLSGCKILCLASERVQMSSWNLSTLPHVIACLMDAMWVITE